MFLLPYTFAGIDPEFPDRRLDNDGLSGERIECILALLETNQHYSPHSHTCGQAWPQKQIFRPAMRFQNVRDLPTCAILRLAKNAGLGSLASGKELQYLD